VLSIVGRLPRPSTPRVRVGVCFVQRCKKNAEVDRHRPQREQNRHCEKCQTEQLEQLSRGF